MTVEVSVRSRGSLPRLMPHHSTDGTSPLHLLQNFISRPHTGRTCPRDAHDLQNRIGIAPSIDPQHHLIANTVSPVWLLLVESTGLRWQDAHKVCR